MKIISNFEDDYLQDSVFEKLSHERDDIQFQLFKKFIDKLHYYLGMEILIYIQDVISEKIKKCL